MSLSDQKENYLFLMIKLVKEKEKTVYTLFKTLEYIFQKQSVV